MYNKNVKQEMKAKRIVEKYDKLMSSEEAVDDYEEKEIDLLKEAIDCLRNN